MTGCIAARRDEAWTGRSLSRCLGLAASPVFALMAWLSAGNASGSAICASTSSAPMDGMVGMYLLMSLFHLPPWLNLAARRHRRPIDATTHSQGH